MCTVEEREGAGVPVEAPAAERRGRVELLALGVDVVSSSDTLFEERIMEDSRPGEARSGLLVRVNVGSVGEAGRPKACEPPQKGGFYW